MTCVLLLFMCWCSSILTMTCCIRVDGYSCVTAYREKNITCVVNITGNPTNQSNYSLRFISRSINIDTSCPLVRTNDYYSCVCGLQKFRGSVGYEIKFCNKSGCDPLTDKFSPYENIQLTPPSKAEVHSTAENVNISWKSGYETHRYLKDQITYQIFLQTSHSKDNLFHKDEKNMSLKRSLFQPGATYSIRVRAKPKIPYNGPWSKWSPSISWKNEAEEEQDSILVLLSKYLVPVCVAVGVLLLVFFNPATRMKIKQLSVMPSPARFFQPLFQQHEGNLQEWFTPNGKFVLTYTTEEIATVMIEPKSLPKEPEETPTIPSVTQPTFTQCHDSYVGLPGIHEPPPPMTMACPANMSYTQLPCSVWGGGFGGVEVASSSSKELFSISHSDSGCEDLTQSPECSLPNSPVEDRPPPCYSTDYCVLNKTADGFAPVLVSRGENQTVQSNAVQEGKS